MKMETVEHFAKIALVTHLLGNEQPLGEKEVEKLHEVRHRYKGGAAPVAPGMPVAGEGLRCEHQSGIRSGELDAGDVHSHNQPKETAGSHR
jgi:hypothetical protein